MVTHIGRGVLVRVRHTPSQGAGTKHALILGVPPIYAILFDLE